MKVRAIVLVACAWGLAACGGNPCGAPDSAVVARVIDGDTVVLANGDRVRYLLIDAPETTEGHHDCYGQQAADYNTQLVMGRHVQLTYDAAQCKDRYGRWLAYVSVDGLEVNKAEVEQGLACEDYLPPAGTDRAQEFDDAQSVAKTARIGLWGACNPVTCK